ncbi:MAG: hypothetical protein WDW36_000969 [Sanguina aurantia]
MQAGSHSQRQSRASAGNFPGLTYREGYTEVAELRGVRIVQQSDLPKVEYLVHWKDGSGDTWELSSNLSEDLLREYEEKWWAACKKADAQTMISMLAGGREVLANAVDENKRSGMHFAAALGSVDCTKIMVEAGADLDLQDVLGYTPLHMAAGYMYTAPMAVLVEAGADPEIKDSSGKDVVKLVDNLRSSMPLNLQTVQRRLALEEVSNVLTEKLYDEVEPLQILEVRQLSNEFVDPADPAAAAKMTAAPERQFLVAFGDGQPDEWVNECNVASDIISDYEAGLEYAEAESVIDVAQVGTERRFKVRWADDYPPSWEAEEHLPTALISLFQQQQPQLFSDRTAAGDSGNGSSAGFTGHGSSRPAENGNDSGNGSSNGNGSSSAESLPAKFVTQSQLPQQRQQQQGKCDAAETVGTAFFSPSEGRNKRNHNMSG